MNRKFFLLVLIFLFMSSVSAAPSFILEKDADINYEFKCLDANGNFCNSSISCFANINFPNGTVAYDNSTLTRTATYYNHTLPTQANGDYNTLINCIGPLGATSTFDYRITSSGTDITQANSGIISLGVGFFLILGILFFLGFYRASGNIGIAFPVKWTFFILGFLAFLTSTNLISTLISDSLINAKVIGFFDSFTGISFILYWLAFGLLGVMWFLTFLQTILVNRNKSNLQKYG